MADEEDVQIIGDEEWLDEALRRKPGSARVRIRPSDEDDAEGHGAATRRTVTVLVETDDDTEGHAISLHFPSAQEAEAFRKRLLVTGVLVGAVALGAAGGYALTSVQPDATTGLAAGAAVAQPVDANADVGVMDASGALAVGAAVAAPVDADTDIGVMDASGAAAIPGAADNADEPPELVIGPR
jgi:hypothetical protein